MSANGNTIEEALQKIALLRRNIARQFLQIGGWMVFLQDRGLPAKEIAFKTGYSTANVYSLIRVKRAVLDKQMPIDLAVKIGYTKTLIAVGKLRAGYPLSEIRTALETSSAHALSSPTLIKPNTTKFHTSFNLSPEEKQALDEALIECGALRHASGLRGKEQALMTLLVRAAMATARKKKSA